MRQTPILLQRFFFRANKFVTRNIFYRIQCPAFYTFRRSLHTPSRSSSSRVPLSPCRRLPMPAAFPALLLPAAHSSPQLPCSFPCAQAAPLLLSTACRIPRNICRRGDLLLYA